MLQYFNKETRQLICVAKLKILIMHEPITVTTQQKITCSKSTIETLEKDELYVQS